MTAASSHKCLTASAAGLLLVALAANAQTLPPNPLARGGLVQATTLSGTWNGANIEQRSHCNSPQNEGFHGTYAEYVVGLDPLHSFMTITESAVNGLRCSYDGTYSDTPTLAWSGTLACSDGKRGTFEARSFLVTPNEMSIRLAIKLNGGEVCDVDAILGGSRF